MHQSSFWRSDWKCRTWKWRTIKIARGSSANIVQDCQNFFRLLPVSNLIDIRTARFLEEFTINENHVCTLFVRNAQCSLAKVFSMYSHDIVSTCNLNSFMRDMFFFGWHYHAPYVHLVNFFSFFVLLPMWWNKDEYKMQDIWKCRT